MDLLPITAAQTKLQRVQVMLLHFLFPIKNVLY